MPGFRRGPRWRSSLLVPLIQKSLPGVYLPRGLMKRSALLLAVVLASTACAQTTEQPSNQLQWLSWSDEVFSRAKHEHRFVLLDLEAVWCHWCHVMDVTTYRDPKVIALLNKKYLTVPPDQDAPPNLSHHSADYA